jgi:hypothetical protein
MSLLRQTRFWVGVVILIALLPRLILLETVPVGSDGDVAWYGINALDGLDRGVWPYYIRELYGAEPLSVYAIGAMIPFVGISMSTARLASALWNVLGILLCFPAAWWLLADQPQTTRRRAGVLAALALALSLHAVHIARLGLPATFIPTTFILLIAGTAWARVKGGWWRWALAGAALALTNYIYIAARVIPLAVVVWCTLDLLLVWREKRGLRQAFMGWLIMAAVAILLVLPNLITYATQPRAFFGRAEAANPYSGALIWTLRDLESEGGLAGLFLQKVANNARAAVLDWRSGPYTTFLEQPILTPLFALGLLLSVGILLRYPRERGYAWLWIAVPVVLLPDLLTSRTPQPHAMRQINALALYGLLAGMGLAQFWAWIESSASPVWLRRQTTRITLGGLAVLLMVVPSAWDFYRYFVIQPPQLYANPETSWRSDQASLDITRRLVSDPATSYLIPYTEWERSTISWLTAGVYRDRRSAVDTLGNLTIPDPPTTLTVLQPVDPFRVRWDGTTAQVDDRLWVLLHQGHTYLLPPLATTTVDGLRAAIQSTAAETQFDQSGQPIARYYTFGMPSEWFAPQPVIAITADRSADFNGQLRLLGSTVPTPDLQPGQVFFVTLYWQIITPPTEDYEVVVQLWDDAGNALASWQNVPFGAMYRTRIWRMDETLATHHWLQVPADAPPGRYRLMTAIFRTLMGQRVPVMGPLADPVNQIATAATLRIPLPITPTPLPELTVAPTFGSVLRLEGMETASGEQTLLPGTPWMLAAGSTITLRLGWSAVDAPPLDAHYFVHLVPAGEAVPVAQVDGRLRPDFPTSIWRTGETYAETLEFVLPAEINPGAYQLVLGLYDLVSSQRLPIEPAAESLPDARWLIAPIRILPPES